MESIDGLPPEARFLLRALHAGLSPAEAGGLIALGEDEAARRLRAALVRAGESAPPASAGADALVAAAAPLVALAGRPPSRAPATACLPDAVAGALAHGRLAGPLLLASAEHVADCPRCLGEVLDRRSRADDADTGPPPSRSRGLGVAALVIVLLTIATVAALLLL